MISHALHPYNAPCSVNQHCDTLYGSSSSQAHSIILPAFLPPLLCTIAPGGVGSWLMCYGLAKQQASVTIWSRMCIPSILHTYCIGTVDIACCLAKSWHYAKTHTANES